MKRYWHLLGIVLFLAAMALTLNACSSGAVVATTTTIPSSTTTTAVSTTTTTSTTTSTTTTSSSTTTTAASTTTTTPTSTTTTSTTTSSTTTTLDWQPLGSSGFSGDYSTAVSLRLNDSGTQYVAFSDNAVGLKARVMKYNGLSWEDVGLPGFTTDEADCVSLSLSSEGTPYVAFHDGYQGRATVMKFNGTTWEVVGSPGFTCAFTSLVYGSYLSLAVSPAGTPYVAYRHSTSGTAQVMRFNGTTWEAVDSPLSSGNVLYTALFITSDGIPYVAYQDGCNGNKATVKKLNGSNWETVGTVGFSEGYPYNISLFVSNAGVPYLAFRDKLTLSGAAEGGATVMKYNGVSWECVGARQFASNIEYPSLFIANDGTPYLGYQNYSNYATVKKFNGVDWEDVGAPGFSEGFAAEISLAVNSAETSFVAYRDGEHASKVTVMYHVP